MDTVDEWMGVLEEKENLMMRGGGIGLGELGEEKGEGGWMDASALWGV